MKKVLKWTGIVVGLLILFLLLAPFLFKGKIIDAVKQAANENLEADFNFSSLDLSLIRSFPNLSVSLHDLSIINHEPFRGDTLVYARTVSVTVDLMSVISGKQINISRVLLDAGVLHFLVNKDAKANWDIAKPSPPGAPEGEPSAFKASLKKYEVTGTTIVYDDRTLDFRLQIDGLNHEGKGDFTQDLFVLSTHSDAAELTLNYGGVDYLKKVKTVADADLDMDMKNFKFTFKDNHLVVNDLPVAFSGWLAMPAEDIDMDLKFSTQKSEFKSLISLIPAIYASQFDQLTASGKVAFEGFVKGRYNDQQMPGFGLTLNVENGAFKYPSLPSELRNVQVGLSVINPDGIPDHTVTDLKKFHMEMAGDAFDARLLVKTPVSDPDLDAFFRGRVDLSKISSLVPLEKGTALSGIITSDVSLKGRMSAIEKQQYSQFDASGTLRVTGLNYSSAAMQQPTAVRSLEMSFSPRQVALNQCEATVGQSDFSATGSLENFIAYAVKGDVLKGSLNLSSSVIDLNEFMTGETAAATPSDTTSFSVLEVPANIDFTLKARVGKVRYQDLVIEQAAGALVIRDRAVRMQDVTMQLIGGSVKMNGSYSSADPKRPKSDFDMVISNMDIKKAAAAFTTVGKLAPVAKYANGLFSSQLTFASELDAHMQPVLETASGYGRVTTQAVSLSGFEPANKLADALKISSLKQLTVPNTNISFKIIQGRIFVEPFDITVNGIKSTVAGSNGLDQTLDYGMKMNVPRALFGGAANAALDNLIRQANTAGASFSAGDQIPVEVGMKGTVTDPKISVSISKAGTDLMKDLKAQAAAELEARAKAEQERLKKEAEDRLNAEKDKAAAEADRLKKEAETKAKAYADSVKKAAQKQAKDQLEQFNPFKKK
jgi:hypothetical protein